MANIIKRKTTVIYYECLVNTSMCKAGTKCIAYKDDTGWKTGIKDNNGKVTIYQTFIAHLRNENFTKIIKQA